MGKGRDGVTRGEIERFRCTTTDGEPYELDVQENVLRQARPQKAGGDFWLWGERAYPGGMLRGLAVAHKPQRGQVISVRLAGLGVTRLSRHEGLGRAGLQVVVRDLVTYAAGEDDLVIRSEIHVDNVASKRLCTGEGFEPVGTVREDGYQDWALFVSSGVPPQ